MASTLFDDSDDRALRREALEGVLVELVRGSLRPLTHADLASEALRLLEERWSDVRLDEIDEAAAELEHEAIERDRWGFHAVHPARSLDDAWPHLLAANDWADVAALTEGPAQRSSDIRGHRALFAKPLLRQREEIHLGARRQRGDQLARNELIEANTRWVLQLTRGFVRQASTSLDFDDLFQAGCTGLIRAAEKFDPSRGYKFSTYATWWIRQAIQRTIADQGRTIDIPVHIHERLRRVRREESQFERRNGRVPSDTELAQLADVTVQQLRELQSIPVTTPLNDADAESLADRLTPSVEEVVDRHALQDIVRSTLRCLPARERIVLEARHGFHGEPRTLDDIGRELTLTRERVRQIETQALKRLWHLEGIASLAPIRRAPTNAERDAARNSAEATDMAEATDSAETT